MPIVVSPTKIKSNRLTNNCFFPLSIGIKILMVCFESQLHSEWFRVARTVREMGNRHFGSAAAEESAGPLWRFLDFVATHRNALYTLLLPFMYTRLAGAAAAAVDCGDVERHFQVLQVPQLLRN